METRTTDNQKPINILLVEDNPSDSRLVDIYLEEAFGNSYILSVSSTLSETQKILKEKNFDVIILDLGLPDSGGLETFTETYKVSSQTPIIILTGMIEEQIGSEAIKRGAQDFLNKGTLKSTELKRAINYSIERYRLLEEIVKMKKDKADQKEPEKKL